MYKRQPDLVLTLVPHQEPVLSCGTCWACVCADADGSSNLSGGGGGDGGDSCSCENTDSPDGQLSFAAGTLTLQRLPGHFGSADEVRNAVAAVPENSSGGGKVRRSARLAEKQRAKTVAQQIQGVDSAWTVQGLKMHLFANYDPVLDCGMPDAQVLVLDGTVLDDERTLESYCVRDGATTLTLGILSPSIGKAAAAAPAAAPAGATGGGSSSGGESQRPLETGFAGSRLLRASGPVVSPPTQPSP